MKKHSVLLSLLTMLAVVVAANYTYYIYVDNYDNVLYGVAIGLFVAIPFWSMFLLATICSFKKRRRLIASFASAAASGIFMNAVALIFNNLLHMGERYVGFGFLIVLVGYLTALGIAQIILAKDKKKLGKVVSVLLILALGTMSLAHPILKYVLEENYKKVATPMGFSKHTEREYSLQEGADFYVSNKGSDENDGSLARPFATIERAKEAVKNMDKSGKNGIKVAIMAGEYRTSGIEFSEEDSGTATCPITYCAYGDGEVKINGGLTISPSSFAKVSDKSVMSRLGSEARENVRCVSLFDLGITADDYGKIYAIGNYNTASKYDGDYVGGIYSELFFNDQRMTVARYPNEGFLGVDSVVETGQSRETSDGAVIPGWDDLVNPKGDTYRISKEMAKRIDSWQTFDDVWMFGYFRYNWADASTPIGSFDAKARTLTTKFVSGYGTNEEAIFYFFNVLEELDTPGEWYLDRANGMMYIYPIEDMSDAKIELALTQNDVISVENADYLTFYNLTICGTRADAVNVSGDNITICDCLIKNVSGNAVVIEGYNNLVQDCEITHTGKGGILMSGGDTQSLTPGNSRAYNNLIHDWSEVYSTYQPAVCLDGVGNLCDHNEIFNSPHEAITYYGNNHVIEYNEIHDVCKLSDDAGAIYAGKSWVMYGNVIRYNAIYDMGDGDHSPSGIYMDDGLSGQTIYGNIMVNVPNNGIQIGSGRDMVCMGNIVINSRTSLSYDDRTRDGATNKSSRWVEFKEGGICWKKLFESPWQTVTWQKEYPIYREYVTDFSDTENPYFVANPAGSKVSGNAFFTLLGINNINVTDSVYRYSDVSGNKVYALSSMSRFFCEPDDGDYSLCKGSGLLSDFPEFAEIPISEIGRE